MITSFLQYLWFLSKRWQAGFEYQLQTFCHFDWMLTEKATLIYPDGVKPVI